MTTTYRSIRLIAICLTLIILMILAGRGDGGQGAWGCWDEPNVQMPNMYERICGDLNKMPVRSVRAPLPPYTEND